MTCMQQTVNMTSAGGQVLTHLHEGVLCVCLHAFDASLLPCSCKRSLAQACRTKDQGMIALITLHLGCMCLCLCWPYCNVDRLAACIRYHLWLRSARLRRLRSCILSWHTTLAHYRIRMMCSCCRTDLAVIYPKHGQRNSCSPLVPVLGHSCFHRYNSTSPVRQMTYCVIQTAMQY